MPEGEQMFNFHGFSGPCPKPPLPKPTLKAFVEFFFSQNEDGFWIDVRVERNPYDRLGPFATEKERQLAYDDLMNMQRHTGAQDVGRA